LRAGVVAKARRRATLERVFEGEVGRAARGAVGAAAAHERGEPLERRDLSR
jgi:hypothetical protein